jgi:flagellar basal body rod protein FlgC
MIDFNSPLSGMVQAETTVNQVASRLAKPTNDTVDLSAEMVALMQARNSFAVDVRLAQAEEQMTQSALSVLA